MQRQEDDRVVLERHQLPEANGIVAPLGPRMGPLPMLAQQPGDAADPARESGDVAVEDRKLGGERDKADVERALEQLFRGLERGGKVDRLAVELIEVGRQQPLGRREEIEELRVALEIEVGPAGVVGGDEREGEGRGGRWRGLLDRRRGRRGLGGRIQHWGGRKVGATKAAVMNDDTRSSGGDNGLISATGRDAWTAPPLAHHPHGRLQRGGERRKGNVIRACLAPASKSSNRLG